MVTWLGRHPRADQPLEVGRDAHVVHHRSAGGVAVSDAGLPQAHRHVVSEHVCLCGRVHVLRCVFKGIHGDYIRRGGAAAVAAAAGADVLGQEYKSCVICPFGPSAHTGRQAEDEGG